MIHWGYFIIPPLWPRVIVSSGPLRYGPKLGFVTSGDPINTISTKQLGQATPPITLAKLNSEPHILNFSRVSTSCANVFFLLPLSRPPFPVSSSNSFRLSLLGSAMGRTACVTAPIDESSDQATLLPVSRSSVDSVNKATIAQTRNGSSTGSVSDHSTVVVVSGKDEGVQEGPLASFFRVLYEFSTPSDHALRIIGLCAAIASGVALPCMTLVFGSSINELNSFDSGKQSSIALYNALSHNALLFVYLFIARYVLVYIHSSCFGVSGIRATRAFRQQFIKSVIRQDIAFIDSCSLGGIPTTISSNVDMVENGITEKIGSLIQAVSMLVAGFVVAFTQQWKLTLVTATTLPVLFAGFYITFSLGKSSSFCISRVLISITN